MFDLLLQVLLIQCNIEHPGQWTCCATQLHFDFVSFFSPCAVHYLHSPPEHLPPSPPPLLHPLRTSPSPPFLTPPTRTMPTTSLPQARPPSHETPFSPIPYQNSNPHTAIQMSLPPIPASPSPLHHLFRLQPSLPLNSTLPFNPSVAAPPPPLFLKYYPPP